LFFLNKRERNYLARVVPFGLVGFAHIRGVLDGGSYASGFGIG